MQLIIIRHGQSRYNAKETSNLDSELTPEGVRQAQFTANYLALHTLDGFIGRVTPYLRALQTAEIIQEATGIPFEVDTGPREITVDYEITRIPSRKAIFNKFKWGDEDGWVFLRESLDDFQARITKYYESLSGKLLIVSHGTPSSSLYQLACGKTAAPDLTNYVNNASISWVIDGKSKLFNR